MEGRIEVAQRPLSLRGEKGIVLATTLLIMLLLTALGGALLTLSSAEIVQARISQNRVQALNLAEAGEAFARRSLSLNQDLDANGTADQTQVFTNNQNVTLNEAAWNSIGDLAGLQTGATGTIAIARHGTDPDSAVITSTAKLGAATKTVEVVVRRAITIPPGIRGAITANGPVETNGGLVVDGRDHTTTGTLIPRSGGFGIFTASTYMQGGTSKAGGTADAMDFLPAHPGNSATIKTNATPADFDDPATPQKEKQPLTPDEVMGYAEGTLKAMAKSGPPNQYATDPALLTFPLSGVTYVELPPGTEWIPVDLGNSTGIVVVHNSETNAVMRDLKSGGNSCNCFRGLVIADDIIHIHSTLTGAVISLTKAPSRGNVIGNGRGKVLFSRQVLEGLGNSGQKIWPYYAWREVK